MGKITYNYDFLKEWMQRNRLLIKDVAAAIGTTSYQSVNRWADDHKPLNIEAMLKLVNAFDDLLLEDFFMIDGHPMIERLGDGRTLRNKKAAADPAPPADCKSDNEKDIIIASLEKQIKLQESRIESQRETIVTQKMLIDELRGNKHLYDMGHDLMVSEPAVDDR